VSLKCFKRYSSWYKSRFKNVQAAERRIENLSSSTYRREASIDRIAICKIL